MAIKGTIVNGKFVDEYGMVYKFVPEGAEIMSKDNEPGNEPLEPVPVPTEQATTPQLAPQPADQTQQVQSLEYLPRCISIEVREAVQDSGMVQIIVRAHCKGQYADAVVHYDFGICEQLHRLETGQSPAANESNGTSHNGNGNNQHQNINPSLQILKFRKTALMTAQAEAIQIAKNILYEQFRDHRDIEGLAW